MFKVNEKNSRIIVMINKELGDLTVEDIRRQNDGHFRYTVSMSRQFLDQDIHDLDLSVRSYNCLKRAGITTVGDLVNQIDSGSDLLQIRNLGQTSASEIMLCLFLNNYMFLKPEKRKGYLERMLKMNGIERQD